MNQVPTFARNQAGTLIVNPRKLDVQYFTLAPDTPNNPVVVGAGATSPPITFTVSQDGPFEAFFLSSFRRNTGTDETAHAGDILVVINDEAAKVDLMNRECHIDTLFGYTIAGAGIGPYHLPESLFVHATRALYMRFRNASLASADIYPAVHGTRWYGYANPAKSMAISVEKRSARARISTPYFLTTDQALALAGGAVNNNVLFTVTAEAHFESFKNTYVADHDFTIRLFDPRNGRAMSNSPIHCRASIGRAALPFPFPERTLFRANSQLRAEVVNLAAAAANNIYITFGGRKVYVA